jgi:hypothetical protein
MGDIDYLKDVPAGALLVNKERNEVAVLRSTFDRIGDYTRSQPTAPSPGRIYRKNFGWPSSMDDRWFVYVVEQDPNDDGWVFQYPYEALILEDRSLPSQEASDQPE